MSSESTITSVPDDSELIHYPDVIFPAGNSDFRAGRNRCAEACREFNNTPDDADPEQRSQRWLDIVRPNRDRANDSSLAITHDQTFANPNLKAKTPFVKPPIFIDYGVRLQVGGSTFINRNCMIMDTPVADIVIGEGCNIGANCVIIGVTHPIRLDERLERNSIGQPVTIGDNVWIGANVTILGGVTIGDGAVIGACSLVNTDVPPMSVAFGIPARISRYQRDIKPAVPGASPTALTMNDALALPNRLPSKHQTWLDSLVAPRPSISATGVRRGDLTLPCQAGRRCAPRSSEDHLLNIDLLGGAETDLDLDLDGEDMTLPVGSRPFTSESGSTAHDILRGLGVQDRLLGGASRHDSRGNDIGELLIQRRLQQAEQRQRQVLRERRRWRAEAIAIITVAVALLMAFFFAGVYLGASKISGAKPL